MTVFHAILIQPNGWTQDDMTAAQEVFVADDASLGGWSIEHRCNSFPLECWDCCGMNYPGILAENTGEKGAFREYLSRYFRKLEGQTEVAKLRNSGAVLEVYEAIQMGADKGYDVLSPFYLAQ